MTNKHPKSSHMSTKNNTSNHDKEHNTWSRRSFLQTIGLAGGVGLSMGGFSINAIASAPMLMATTSGINDRILVLIRLKGGNDGLNTIIPIFDYGTYKSQRPTIAIPGTELVNLNNKFAIPKTMSNVKNMWDKGAMKIVNSVGYQDHNLSHFTSADIWNSANKNIEQDKDKSGWLGRYILNQRPDFLTNLPEVPAAIKVSSGSNIAYQNEDKIDLAVNFNSPDKLIQVAQQGFLYDTTNLPDNCYYGDQVGYLRSILNVTYKYAPTISTAYSKGKNDVSYSTNELGRQLAIVARLIKGNLGTRLYMVNLDGFDTHENQNNDHPKLMATISNAVSEFYQDLKAGNKDMDVLSMTFSEFGRRVKENNGGTDHGTAAPVMLFGPALNSNGVIGDDPDMKNLDNSGNMKSTTDFRSLYATILESWLCIDPMTVDNLLGNSYNRLELGFDCMNVGTQDFSYQQNILHQARQDGQGGYIIDYEIARPGQVQIEVFTIMGQKIQTLVNEYQPSGKHTASFQQHHGLSPAMMVYRIISGGIGVSGKMVVGG